MTRGTGSESHPIKDTQEPEVASGNAWGYRVVKQNLRKSAPPSPVTRRDGVPRYLWGMLITCS
jgi:hypothetical protein